MPDVLQPAFVRPVAEKKSARPAVLVDRAGFSAQKVISPIPPFPPMNQENLVRSIYCTATRPVHLIIVHKSCPPDKAKTSFSACARLEKDVLTRCLSLALVRWPVDPSTGWGLALGFRLGPWLWGQPSRWQDR